jgi:radical SAM protein (TIGR01212 family)
MKDIYNRYSFFLKNKYGTKVYKLPVNIPVTCPNRICQKGGCTYCDEKGAGYDNLPGIFSVSEQIRKNMDYIGKKYKAEKFIAYFQNFTNTYLPLPEFKKYITEAAMEDVCEIAVSTRPDCIAYPYLDVLKNVSEKYGREITIELGLQSPNWHTLEKINRGHTLAEFIDAVLMIKKYRYGICVHLILNLPWDDESDCIEAAKILSALGVDFIKLHSLYIAEGTKMAEQYKNHEFSICNIDEYKKRVISFLRYLSPDIYVERLVSRAPSDALFANWSTSWWKIRDDIEKEMKENGYFQGDMCSYLGGREVKKFI